MSIKSRFTLLLATLLLLCVGCRDYDPTQEHNPNLGTYFEDGAHFDFSTIGEVQLDIDYGPGLGAELFVQIYDQYPDENEEVEPLYTTVTDSEGRIQNRTLLPKRVKEVWLVNHHIGMPEYVKCSVTNGRIQYKFESPLYKAAGVTRTSSGIDYNDYSSHVKELNKSNKLYTIVSWDDQFGNINNYADNSPLVTKDTELTTGDFPTFVKKVEYSLWEGRTYKPSTGTLHNDKFALGSEKINTKTLDKYFNDDGEEIEVESVSLSFVFMGEWAWNQNVLGYYYYKTEDGAPEKASDIKKFVCLPNASKDNHYPYGGHADAYHKEGEAPAFAGESIALLFEDPETHQFTKNFPPGYTIGYFVIAGCFATKDKQVGVASYNASNTYYSNEEWNQTKTDMYGNTFNKRYVAFSLPNGAIVYSLEDGSDQSFDDVLFTIKGTPNEAIHNPDIPSIDPEEQLIKGSESTERTYVFEDIWPNGGDYDLNDVVIGHTRTDEFDNKDKLYSVEDVFVLNDKHATYHDAFAIQLHKDYLESLKIEKNGTDITNNVKHYTDNQNGGAETYILFEDLQSGIPVGTQFKVTRTFTNKKRSSFLSAESKLNPFVISKYTEVDYEEGSMVEIHIPNFGNRTYKGSNENSTGSEYYYVARNGDRTYPFALCLPVKKFNASPEGVCIDESYPQFNDWVKSKGEKNKEWYLHPSTESK